MNGLYAEARAGSGTPVVLLHGFGASGAIWPPVIERLGRRRVLAYDLPGHGRSLGFPEAGPPSLAAKAIVADLAERQIGTAHFAGHSMGGAIATLVAMRAPQRVASLTLLAPGGYGPEINAPLLRRYGGAAQADEIAQCLRQMSGPDAAIPAGDAARIEAERRVPRQTAMLQDIVALITRGGTQGVIPAESLAQIAAPVAVLWGAKDAVLPVAQMDAMPAHWRRITLPGAGHMLVEEAPEAVADLISAQAEGTAA